MFTHERPRACVHLQARHDHRCQPCSGRPQPRQMKKVKRDDVLITAAMTVKEPKSQVNLCTTSTETRAKSRAVAKADRN